MTASTAQLAERRIPGDLPQPGAQAPGFAQVTDSPPRGQERLKEAAKLGFSIALIPKANAPKQKIEGLTIIAVERIDEALNRVREHE